VNPRASERLTAAGFEHEPRFDAPFGFYDADANRSNAVGFSGGR